MSKYVNEIKNYPNLTKEETERLILEKKQNNNFAREQLITHNLKIVIGLVDDFQGDIDLSIDELINIGSLGLIEAVDSFDGCNDLQLKKHIYQGIKNEFCDCLNRLNTMDGNPYGCCHKLKENTISFEDDLIAVYEYSLEDFVLNKMELENLKKNLSNIQPVISSLVVYKEPITALVERPKQYLMVLDKPVKNL